MKALIRIIQFFDGDDKARDDPMLAMFQRTLDLHLELPAAKNPNDKTRLQREIDATDRQIDQNAMG